MSYHSGLGDSSGYTLHGKSDCRNDATGAHVATTKCAGQSVSVTTASGEQVMAPPVAGMSPLVTVGLIGVLGVGGYYVWKKRRR